MIMHFKSIRFKTTLLFSGILLAILIAFNGVLFFSIRLMLMRDIDEDLEIKAGEISNVLEAYEKIKNISAHPLSMLERLLQQQGVLSERAVIIDDLWRSEFETLKLKEDYINIINGTGQLLMHSHNVTPALHKLMSDRFGFSDTKTYIGTIKGIKQNLRVINLPFVYKENLLLTIQVATPMKDAYRFLIKFMFISGMCVLITVVVTSFLGAFFVRRILRPVVTVTTTANNISHMDLGKRITLGDTDIELKQLIDSFNSMLERLERSFIHINEFNSYVAHELKTPLAIVKGELELAVEQVREKGEDEKMLLDCLEEIDRMIRIIRDLLLLSKLDYKPQILKFQKIDFGAYFNEIKEHSTMLASEKHITVTSDYPQERIFIRGDKVHLRRLFLNVINNAVIYTPSHGKIHLAVRRVRNIVHVAVSDTGPGISEEHLQKIFDKFFRADKEEKAPETGSGLGLSIALSIAKAHQGDIRVTSKLHEGTTFTISLPVVRATSI